eukprot:TRINITY_DN3940_c0_g1_i5.p1 TRINITY_DN3940_c0_g1~~TRINITY_DN3940_c0_g1_i5.p1  ORF type:complete len:263 (+),score=78.02 TRINITY_DN3940_c0_g1_i5:81-791(+)
MAASVENFFRSFDYKFDPIVRKHLKNVYATLTMSIMSAAVGSYVHLYTNLLQGGGILFSLLGLGLAIGLYAYPDNGKNRTTRFGMMLGFAFLTGLGLGPLLDMAIMLNPTIVPSALMLTSVVFASFTAAALVAPSGQYLYLGGTLMSGLNSLLILGLLNLFFRSQLLFQLHMYVGIVVFCGFIMFDTQIIIEKAKRGDRDFVGHSLDLFIDFVQVFRKVLILLMQKENNRNEKKRR